MPEVDVNCQNCNKEFSVDTEYFEIFGKDPYCQNCLIHTKCQSCERPLRIQPSQYQRVGGDPVVCTQCGQIEQSKRSSPSDTRKSNNSFWNGLTIGEKIVFPILILIFVGLMAFLALAEIRGYDVSAGILPPSLLILIYWTYRRGKKNK